jgi:hypothetical protein
VGATVESCGALADEETVTLLECDSSSTGTNFSTGLSVGAFTFSITSLGAIVGTAFSLYIL